MVYILWVRVLAVAFTGVICGGVWRSLSGFEGIWSCSASPLRGGISGPGAWGLEERGLMWGSEMPQRLVIWSVLGVTDASCGGGIWLACLVAYERRVALFALFVVLGPGWSLISMESVFVR